MLPCVSSCLYRSLIQCIYLPQVLLHVLFEHAAGYALFAVKEVEEIGMLLPQVGLLSSLLFALFNLLSWWSRDNSVCVSGGGERAEHRKVQQHGEPGCLLPLQVGPGCSGEHECHL